MGAGGSNPAAWRVGFPGKYGNLDDDHEAIAQAVQQLRDAIAEQHWLIARSYARRFLRLFVEHARREEAAMAKTRYPDAAAHVSHHEDLIGTAETIVSLFARIARSPYDGSVPQHLESKLESEVLVDRHFAAFLAKR